MVAIAAVTKAMTAIGKVKAKTWKAMKSGFETVQKSTDALGNFGSKMGILQDIMKPFVTLFGVFGKMLKGALAPAIQKLFEVLFSPEIMELMQVLAEIIIALVVPALNVFIQIIRFIVDSGFLKILTDGLRIFAKALEFIWKGVMLGVFKAFLAIWKGLGIFFQWLWNLLKPIFDFIMLGFKLFLNVLIGFANMIINIVNLLTLGTLGLKNIPTLDTGGTVTKTGLAIIHKGEDIVPAAEAKNRRRGTGKTGGDTIINIASVRDPRDVRAIEEAIWRTS